MSQTTCLFGYASQFQVPETAVVKALRMWGMLPKPTPTPLSEIVGCFDKHGGCGVWDAKAHASGMALPCARRMLGVLVGR